MFRLPSRRIMIFLAALLSILIGLVLGWSALINTMLPADCRPARIPFARQQEDPSTFQEAVAHLRDTHPDSFADFKHVELFRQAGLAAYAGPQTCLGCHKEISFTDETGTEVTEDLLQNLTGSVHYRFYSTEHPNVFGFNGRPADGFPMGKLNRPCPKPGSIAMTAWAEIVVTTAGDTLSEGCGQCHIGGQYQPPLGEMMPLYRTRDRETEAIDCLICHSAAYDMNRRVVVTDPGGRRRWGQDRSLTAALAVVPPTAQACLRCHQHNFGGDIYVDEVGPVICRASATPATRAHGSGTRVPSGEPPTPPAGTCTPPPAWPAPTATRPGAIAWPRAPTPPP